MSVFIPDPELLESPRGRLWSAPTRSPRPLAAPVPEQADVVVVGAGPAGLAVVCALWHHGVRDVVVLDRDPRPCGRFFARIDALEQRVLRSPYEHHPGVEGYRDCELLDFARLHWGRLTDIERGEVRMAQSGQRSVVPVDLFAAYCDHLADTHGVRERLWAAEVREVGARKVEAQDDAVHVDTGTGTTRARYVVLCVGEERRDAPGAWWDGTGLPPSVRYWDDPSPPGPAPARVVVVGAGLSAAHRISAALDDGALVDWVVRAPAEHYQCADVNAAFFRPEGRARFDGAEPSTRRALLTAQRRPSIMFEFRPRLQRAETEGALVVHRGRAVTSLAGGRVRLDDGSVLRGDRVELALGTVPGGLTGGAQLLDPALAHDEEGLPDLDPQTLAYRHAPRVHAVGAAAAMALGPAARNIDGHRVATARVAAAVAAGLRRGTPLSTGSPEAVAGG